MADRRASARITPRKKYTVDAFDGIEALQSEISSADERLSESEADENDAEEFRDMTESSGPDEDDMSGLEVNDWAEEASDGDSPTGDRGLDDDFAFLEDSHERRNGYPGFSSSTAISHRKAKRDSDGTYTRGVPEDFHNRVAGELRKLYYYGPSQENFAPVDRALAKWAHEPCLPSRQVKQDGTGGLAYNSFFDQEMEMHARNWQWYLQDGGREVIQKRQSVKVLEQIKAQQYMPVDGIGERSFIMGPLNQQKIYRLAPRQAVSTNEVFGRQNQTNYDSKNAFVLNLGAKVQSLDWAPNQAGQSQYLAVSVLPNRGLDAPSLETFESPAFTPQRRYKSSIQIWEFTADTDGYLDPSISPKLSIVFGMAVGDIRCLKWCSVPSKISEKLGLLAFVSNDGAIRVLDVDRPLHVAEPVCLVVENFAFESKPPDTICTCLTWMSSNRIAAGCANGCIAIWDLTSSLRSPEDNPRPTIYTSISTTYIITVATCYPTYPNMLMASSMSGYLTLTDLAQPNPASPSGTVLSSRSRIGQPILVWHDFGQVALSVDDGHMARAYPLRRWFATVGVGRFKSLTLCMAASPCHPFILAGTTNGDVIGVNPFKRIALGGKIPIWQQTWFKHEWRRPTVEEKCRSCMSTTPGGGVEAANAQQFIGKDGLTRISEGYKTEQVTLHSDGRQGPSVQDGVQFTTIYEEQTAITALAWNPNIHVGGWAAAGMADGLLRVEDIAS